jgi:hypothetical protein
VGQNLNLKGKNIKNIELKRHFFLAGAFAPNALM